MQEGDPFDLPRWIEDDLTGAGEQPDAAVLSACRSGVSWENISRTRYLNVGHPPDLCHHRSSISRAGGQRRRSYRFRTPNARIRTRPRQLSPDGIAHCEECGVCWAIFMERAGINMLLTGWRPSAGRQCFGPFPMPSLRSPRVRVRACRYRGPAWSGSSRFPPPLVSGRALTELEHRKGDPQHFYVQRRKARNRVSASVKSTPPMTSNARNCGQTTLNPAPRNRMACDSMTKWVVGAPSMMF